ncbi:MAG TPA: hypothetical protein DDY18_07380 [Flavobacterium sp.]|nr:hypothetical protein [Flavobacterium sp.]
MADLILPDLPQDMTKEEKEAVQEFINNGCPGIVRVQDGDIFKFFQLYMSGKTYAEIATITKAPKDLIMYLAYRSRWMEHRFKHYENISLNILDKIKQVKLDSANNLVTIVKALGQYCEMKYNSFLSTKNQEVIEKIDSKIVTQYFKAIELLDKVLSEEPGDEETKPKGPLVNVNVGLGASATIKQTDAKTLEITDETAGDLVKALASMKKQAERR